MIPTGQQIRESRVLVEMTQADLAKAAKVDLALIMRAEVVAGLPMITKRDAEAIRSALEAAGVVFIDCNGAGPGVCLYNSGAMNSSPLTLNG